jgi:hypothetical protein
MQKFVFIIFLILSISLNVFAESEEDYQYEKQRASDKRIALKNIPKIIEQYASTLGCNVYFEPKNVVEYQIENKTVYVGLLGIDTGCSGGSAMGRPFIVTLTWGLSYNYSLYVDSKYSLPHQTDELPQNMSRIYVHNNKLWYEAKEFDFKKDALCCPSVSVRGELRFENGMWKGYPISKK